MKTPIQELIEHFTDAWSSPSDLWKPSEVIAKIETMLQKEQEFIVDIYKTKIYYYPAIEKVHNDLKSKK